MLYLLKRKNIPRLITSLIVGGLLLGIYLTVPRV
nr:MAG TPA: hypothetical protein [Caudoviricetes sp.]DAN92172.1 MAG TPA: hypothetical protein [Caudoviricetes sp.]